MSHRSSMAITGHIHDRHTIRITWSTQTTESIQNLLKDTELLLQGYSTSWKKKIQSFYCEQKHSWNGCEWKTWRTNPLLNDSLLFNRRYTLHSTSEILLIKNSHREHSSELAASTGAGGGMLSSRRNAAILAVLAAIWCAANSKHLQTSCRYRVTQFVIFASILHMSTMFTRFIN